MNVTVGVRITSTAVYIEVNYEVEHLASKITSSAKIVFPLFVVPLLTQSYINYYVKGMGEDAFIVTSLAA